MRGSSHRYLWISLSCVITSYSIHYTKLYDNLYDEQHITFENARLIKKSFARLKSNDIAIVYAHGSLDKGYFLDSIENDIIEIKNRYTSQVYSLPFGIDSVCFEGIGYSKRLVFQDEYLEPKKDDTPAVGIMYIDSSLYKGETLELLHRRNNFV